jgi:hypothetical protein
MKAEGKNVPVRAMKAYEVKSGIEPITLILDTRRK